MRFPRFLLLAWTLATPAWADTVTLAPAKDNTIFSESGTLSSGVGSDVFCGRTGSANRRALLAFDLSSVPTGAIIDSVQLQLTLTHVPSDTTPRKIRLFRVLADWGEGASDSPLGQGAPAQTGDATWLNTFFPSSTWISAGGDVAVSASDSLTVGGFGSYVWRSAGLAGDVHGWTSQTFANYGWMLIGDEVNPRTARGFSSREGGTPPQLTIYYSVATPVSQTTWGKIKIRYR